MKVAILQSNYIPWKGYFDIIHDVDLFIFYDDVQYTKNDWRNRNRIKSRQSSRWLTIPTHGSTSQLIHEVGFANAHWQEQHWRTISQSYARAPHFASYRDLIEPVYRDRVWTRLSDLNQHLIQLIAREALGMTTTFADSRRYSAAGSKQDRLLDILAKCCATTYVSGPAARDYIDEASFTATGIDLIWKDYTGYPEYPQLSPPFEHGVSILDLLFNVGSDAPYYIWRWRDGAPRPRPANS